jgi:hypothetical protein
VMGFLCVAALGDVHGAGPRAAGRGDSIRTESGKNASRITPNVYNVLSLNNLKNSTTMKYVLYQTFCSMIGAVQ